jgi:vancomycin resistance protein YoaR
MRASNALSRIHPEFITYSTRALAAAASAVAAIVVGATGFVLITRLVFSARALPGVSAAGIPLTGMTQAEIETALGHALTYPQTGIILLRDGEQPWSARPAELGVVIDIPAVARQALAVGRTGNVGRAIFEQYQAWTNGTQISPVVIFDQRAGTAYLQSLAEQIDQPELLATLQVTGLQVEAIPGQVGRQLDIQATLDALAPIALGMLDAEVPLVIVETPPLVLDASEQAAIARTILSQPLTLTAEGAGPWTLEPNALAGMLRFLLAAEEAGGRYEVGLDAEALGAFLEPLAPELARAPENARFIFNDETRQLDLLREAVIGRSLDLPASVAAINAGLVAGGHQIELVFQTTDPPVRSDATAEQLGITENVVAVSTYFAGSSAGRIQNIRTASGAFHGLLVAPGDTLSMAEVLGEISLDTGYTEALIIFGDRTIQGLGGGVCQVSTTLFRAAFFGGYQIDERHPHAYRVSYYEQGRGSPGPGLDATVFVPRVDFRFTNDTPYWILLETYIYGNQLLWKIYSTSDGRQVTWQSSGPTNVVEAQEPLYRENGDLPSGEIKQVDYEADGMDVTVTRTVTRGDATVHQDTFRTHYLPWRAIYEYGPGSSLPEGARTE